MKILLIFLFLFSTSIRVYSVQQGPPSTSEVSESILTPCKKKYRQAFNSDPSNFIVPADKDSSIEHQNALNDSYAKRSSGLAYCLVTKTDEILNSRFIKNSELSVNISAIEHGYSGSVEFESVAPLWQNADESQVLFLQPGFVLSIKSNSRSSFDLNTGVVYRFTFSRGVIGFNLFHDVSYVFDDGEGNSLTHRRGSVGADYQSGRNHISFNYYFPITDWINVNEYYKEHALGGFDIHFKRLLTKRLSLKTSLSYWDYQREPDRINPSVGLEYKTGCNSHIGLDLTFDPVHKDVTVRSKFSVKWGGEARDPSTCLQEDFDKSASVWTPVERENRVLYERVRRAPQLKVPNQITQRGVAYSYTISNTNFRHVKDGETPHVTVTSQPDWLNYEPRSMRFSGIPDKVGIYQVSGTISLPREQEFSPWKFHIIVEEEDPPSSSPLLLTTRNHVIEAGRALSYQIADNNISGLREGESARIIVLDSSVANVSYDSVTKTFSSSPLNNVGIYTISGIISGEDGQESPWSFTLTVQDTNSPRLATTDQTIGVGTALSYQIASNAISGLREGEVATITVTKASAAGVRYDFQTKTFSTSTLDNTGVHTIEGTISDGDGNKSPWSFTLTVEESANLLPRLATRDHTIEVGTALSYQVQANDISGLDEGEVATITVTKASAANVRYNTQTKIFSTSTLDNTGVHTIEGTISDGDGNKSPWSFTLTVEDTTALSLFTRNHVIEVGQALSYQIQANDISGLRSGESATIRVDTTAANMSYNAETKTFSTPILHSTGFHIFGGVILDGDGNIGYWTFNLTVIEPVPPSLVIRDQAIEVETAFSYRIQSNDIREIKPGESATIEVTTASAANVRYNSQTKTFSTSTLDNTGVHRVEGTISDEDGHESPWSFKLTVQDTKAPSLATRDQTIEVGTSMRYWLEDEDISGLRSGERAKIRITQPSDAGVRFNRLSLFFSTGVLNNAGVHRVEGTISDEDGNTRPWSFKLTVQDTKAPSLATRDQTIEVGTALSYQIQANDISGLRSGERATITVTTASAVNVRYNSQTKTFSTAILNEAGLYTISGIISDGASNSSNWSFKLKVEDRATSGPVLATRGQTVEAGESWSYAFTDDDISDLREGETATIAVTSQLPTGVSYSSRTFSASSLNTPGEYTISGTISDGSNSNTWEFKLTVEDTTGPSLTLANQTVEQRAAEWSYEIIDSNISSVRDGEELTITPSLPTGVSYNSTTRTFSASSSVLNTSGEYTISGTISDNSGNSNAWSFKLTVEADNVAPTLALADQTVEAGESWSYQITDDDISGLRAVETATILFTSSLPTGVSYNSNSKTFSASTLVLNTPDEYTVSGTISDEDGNTNTWEFKLTVEDTTRPILTLANQTVEVGQSWSYEITDNNITGLRSGETATIAVTSSLPTGVSYSSRTFSASSLNTPGEYTISGTIADNSGNTNTWSFKLTVEADETAPSLALENQTVEAGESWSYEITDSNISGLRDGETATIAVTSSLPTGVSYSSRTFSASSLNTPGEYTISGTISDGSNSNTWEFKLTVEDTIRPILTLANQTVEVGQSWSYEITDNNITGLRSGETATIAVTSSLPTGVSYSSRTFSASSLNTPGEYTISGTIADNSGNTNTWSFKLTVGADETAPSLALTNQTVEAGESWSYEITDSNITGLRDGETATIAVTSSLPTGVSYSSRTFSASSLNVTGEYTISGTISDGSNSNTWSFTLTVEDTIAPSLTIANQTVEVGQSWSYEIVDNNISDLRDGETATIAVTSSLPTGVSYSSRTFSASRLNTPGEYTISGTIADNSGNTNTWSFKLTVGADETAPSLALADQTVEAGESWSYEITDSNISGLRDGETATIAVTSSLPTGVSYSSRTFSASSLNVTGEYTISGTISDGSNSNTWSFTLTVEDTTAPSLSIANQTVEVGQSWSYEIVDNNITGLRSGETATIAVTSSLPTGVSYDSNSRTFSASSLNTSGEYTISGTIADNSSNSNTWSFKLTVGADETAPSLALANQTVEAGESWSYAITDSNISDLRDGETATIAVTSTLPTGVSYNSSSRTFSASSLNVTGEYTISGTISDGSNSNTWSFTLTVEDTTKPILTLANQTVEVGQSWSYEIVDNNISDLRDGETATIAVTSQLPTGVSYSSSLKTFSASSLNTPGEYTISGTIADNSSNTNTWSFKLTVGADETAPSLALENQTVEAGESWSYAITDEAISDLRDVETATIAITSTLPTGVSYDSTTRTFSASSLDTVDEYTISGTISDGSNSNTWSFTLTVEDTTKPILTIANQTVEQRTSEWSYEIQDEDISDLRDGETVTILFTSSVPTGVSYNSTTRTFSASTSVLNTPDDYTISGTIVDSSGNVNTWEFTLTVETDDTAPSLALADQTVEAGESWSYAITDEAISDLRDVETATIAVTSTLPTGVSYDSNSRTFSASSLNTLGESTISGTISDGSNSNTWSFTLTVEDTTKPILTIANQTVEQRTAEWSYEIQDEDISDLRDGESVTILFTSSVPTGVSYNSTTRTFSASTSVLNTPDDYTISGTIADGSGNVNTWEFTLTVETDDTAPSLTLTNQTVEAGESWSYAITDNNISDLRDGETATIAVTSTLPTGVSYNSSSRTFSASSLNVTGESTISGTISDGSNSNTWSFTLTVEDTTRPILTIANQTVEVGQSWSYEIVDNNISDLRDGETATIAVTSQLPTGVSYNSSSRTFSASSLNTSGEYTISGTIADNSSNTNTWSFKLTVGADETAPSLALANQTVEAGESWSYAITDNNITGLRSGETATIAVTSTLPTGVSYDSNSRTFSASSLNVTGEYTISGTISDGSNSNTWSFTLTVEDTTRPILTIANQTVEVGQSWSYEIVDNNISDLRDGETATIAVTSTLPTGVSYDSNSRTFSASSLNTPGEYTISGTISDGSNSNTWSFKLTVGADETAPSLALENQTVEAGESWSYAITDSNISDLRDGETATIAVTSQLPTGVSYDSNSRTFSASSLNTPGEYTISGTIADNSSNSNTWSFKLTVGADETAPSLALADQTVEAGESWSYAITDEAISDLRDGETAIIAVTSTLPTGVSYDSNSRTFSASSLNTLGESTISGTISDEDGNTNSWEFKLTVEDTTAPTLTIADQTVEQRTAEWSYEIVDNNISDLRDGETATIAVTSQLPTGVEYNSSSKTFSASSSILNTSGEYTISGTISDGSNSNTWEFKLTVEADNTAPSLALADQTVEAGDSWSYEISDDDISGLRTVETATILFTSSLPTGVSYNSTTRTFSASTLVLNTPDEYTVSGTISDEDGNTNSWEFKLTVEDTTAPTLTIADQTVEQRTAEWSYEIIDSNISSVRDGEELTITHSLPTGVSYNSTTRTFSASSSVLDTPGEYTISGTISDGSNSNTWEFKLTVETDDTAPSLALTNQTVEAGESWSYEITDEAISDLRDVETATIAVTSQLPTGVSYDSNSKTFSASSLDTVDEYTISGTISDGSNSNTWEFTLTVEDTTKPILTIANQTVEQRTAEWSYVIQDEDISDVRDGETVTILFTSSVPTGVSYNSSLKTFSASTSALNTPDDYTISGTIADGSGNVNTWEFTLTVETDDTAPSLALTNQTVEAGESWSYEITDEAISDLRDVETATIAVTSTLPTGVSYDSNSKTFSASSLNTLGESTISGTISDGSNSNTWSFTLTVEDTTAPSLTIANQTVEVGQPWSYEIVDNNISDLRDGETATIAVTSSLPTGVSYSSRTFSASSLDTVGEYTISGTISDGSNSNTWSFKLTVGADETAPSLALADQTVEAGESWSYAITDEAISDLRDVETATIAVTSTLPTGVSYDSNSKTFSASSLNVTGESTISGTISDGSNSNTWSFTLTVEDTTAPSLTIANQTVEVGQPWSYEIVDNNISDLRDGETATIAVTSSLPTGVSYSSRTFSASSLDTVGEYTISGTISDGSNSNTWSFKLTVGADETAPSLALADQTVEAGESWSYEITDEAISDLRDGETATIAVTSTLPTGVSYDSNSRTFSASSLDTVGESTISGTISDGSNSNTWSFTLTVEDTTAPSLTIANQTVEVGQPWSYEIVDNNISDLRDGETATIAVTSSLPTGVSYSSRTFSASSLDTVGEYTISGTISDGSNSNTWSFKLTVGADETAPSLVLTNQTVETGESWSYAITDSNISDLRDGETATIAVTSQLPTGVSYDSNSRTFSASSLNVTGESTISGTISDGSNSNTWSFTLTVEDTTAPSLTIANQTVEVGQPWSYEIVDNNISDLRDGETATIAVTSSLPTGVSYSSRTFSASSLDTVGEYTISGTISDGSNSNTWSFKLTVGADETAPSLVLTNQTVEAGESWSYAITDEAISDLRDGETATIAVTSQLPTGVSYDSNSRTFSASSLNTVDEYTISGTISDGSNSNTWEFTLTVEDTTAPTLTIVDQTVEQRTAEWSYEIVDNNISDLRDGETATILFTSSVPTGVSYNSNSRTFSASTSVLNAPGDYTISGTIADGSGNVNTWSFTLTVGADETAPSLALADQTVEAGESWSYEITDEAISDLRDGETATIAITSTLPTGVSYDSNSKTFSASSLNTVDEYTISGTISDGSNSNTWEFTLTVEDTTAPTLTIADQTVEQRTAEWSYEIQDEDISDLRDGETVTILFTSSVPSGVSYNSSLKTFSASTSVLNTPDDYTISGTIADGSGNVNTWEFTLTVETDDAAPSLALENQTVEAGESWSYEITDEAISDLRDVETATIAVTSTLPTGVSYDSTTRTFSASSLNTVDEYTISGTISDGSNSNTWEFTLTVEDTTAPTLTIVDQTVEQRTAEWSYEIQDEDISDVRDGETVTILFTSLVPSGVSYNSTTRTFSASTSALNTPDDYMISGTIADGSGNTNTWEFTLTVETDDTAPSLALADQTVEAGESWSYEITDEAISDLRDVETATIAVTSSLPTGVSYDSNSKTFSASSLNTLGEYTISGTISDGSNSNTWEFTLTVEDTTAPTLTIADQTVEQRTTEWSYEIQDEDITGLRSGEATTILFTSSVPSGVSYNSSLKTFSASTSALNTPDDYTISGTIADGSGNVNNWSFTLTVETDDTAPSLALENQTVEAGESWSYEITDEAISDLRDVETATIAVTSTLPTGVSYDSNSKTFSASSLNTVDEYTISGTISDGSNSNTWSFTLTVEDTTAPSLTIANQTVEVGQLWSYEIVDNNISDLRDGETATIAVTSSLPTGVSYSSRTFSASSLDTVGEYTISGTISDGSNSNTWEFKLTVEADNTAPSLAIADQTVEAGDSWSYEISDDDISGLRTVETATILFTSSLPTGVSYNSTTRTFSASTLVLNTPDEYTISGTISDEDGNTNSWEFKLTVEDTTAPSLTIANQTVEVGQPWSYEIVDNNISDLRDGETATIAVTSSLPTGVSYSSRTFSASSLDTVGEYTISGTISDGSNSNTWSFKLTVGADETAPSLALVDQTVEAGESWSYEITDEAISDLRDVETATIAITSILPTGVSYDSTTRTFSASSLNTVDEYTISGTISDGSNSNTWSFTLTVEDTTAPSLTIANQTVEVGQLWSYEIVDNNISDLRDGETATIAVTSSLPTGVSYSSRTFSASSLDTVGEYTISGTISDGSNSNTWSFKLTVGADETAPSLTLADQTVEAGESWSYEITDEAISDLRNGETATIAVTSTLPTGVSYDSNSRTFSASSLNTLGEYTISGTISDGSNSNTWEFKLTVEDTTKPVLTIADQTVDEGTAEWSYEIIDSNISSVRDGEDLTILFTSSDPTGVSYNSATRTFSASDLDTPGEYTISGTISDDSDNSNTWSFKLIVADKTAPTLIIEKQGVELGARAWSYQIKDEDISDLRASETATIRVDTPIPGGVSYHSRTRTFSAFNLNDRGVYRISGTISDGTNSSRWWFDLVVLDPRITNLFIRDQRVEVGGSWSYRIKDSDIVGLEEGHVAEITLSSHSRDGGVSYNSATRTFSASNLNRIGFYSIEGTISSNGNDINGWSFVLIVEADKTTPSLVIGDQRVEMSDSWSYKIKDGDIINSRSGEVLTIEVANQSAANVSYNATSKAFEASNLNTRGEYTVSGTIEDESGNSSAWSFKLIVEADDTAPSLTIEKQGVELGARAWSYQIKDEDISDLRSVETATIRVDTPIPGGVSYHSRTRTFSAFNLNEKGVYRISGTISDGTNSNPWRFDLVVLDPRATNLFIRDQKVEVGSSWSYQIKDSDIIGLEEGHTASITLSSHPRDGGVTYDPATMTFSASNLNRVGLYSIEGTIASNGGDINGWSFTLTVEDTSPPSLTTRDQTIVTGTALSYGIGDDIDDLRSSETATITVTTPSDARVSYNATSKTFWTPTVNTEGVYRVAGTISDDSDNLSEWSFILTVEVDETAPSLAIGEQRVEAGDSWSYQIEANDISDSRSGEVLTIAVTDRSAANVSYDFATQTFSASNLNALGEYTVSGTIEDESNNSSNWSFNLIVADNTAPSLTIEKQGVGVGTRAWSYQIKNEDISGLRSGETAIIRVDTPLPAGANYHSRTRTFSAFNLNEIGVYRISGTISDGTNSSRWWFELIVLNPRVPILFVSDQRVEVGTRAWSYRIKDSDIVGLEEGDVANIVIFSHQEDGGVTYDPATMTFSASNLNRAGFYSIEGSISSNRNRANVNAWSFVLIVEDTSPPLSNEGSSEE